MPNIIVSRHNQVKHRTQCNTDLNLPSSKKKIYKITPFRVTFKEILQKNTVSCMDFLLNFKKKFELNNLFQLQRKKFEKNANEVPV